MQMLGMHQEERQANTQTKKKKEEVFINHFGSDFVHDGRVVVRHSSCCFCVFFCVCVCLVCVAFMCRGRRVHQCRPLFPLFFFKPHLVETLMLLFLQIFFFWGGGTVDFTNLQSSK